MIIVLTEFLYAEESVHLSGLFFSVQNIIFAVTDRQLLIGTVLSLVSQHRVRAVHRLRRHGVRLFSAVNCSACHHLHGLDVRVRLAQIVGDILDVRVRLQPAGNTGNHKHVVDVVCPVPGNQPEFLVIDQGRRDLRVTVTQLHFSRILQKRLIHLPASGKPVRHAGCCLIEHEQLHLRADLLVITLLRLADQIFVCLERGLVRKSVRVDTGHLIPVLVASPVSAGNRTQLKGGRHQLLRIGNVRSGAEVYIILTGIINSNRLILRKVIDQLCLEFLIFKDRKSLFSCDFLSYPVLFTFQDLPHLVLDGLEVGFLNCLSFRQNKIIIESVLNLRSDRVLHIFAVNFDDGFRQNVRE